MIRNGLRNQIGWMVSSSFLTHLLRRFSIFDFRQETFLMSFARQMESKENIQVNASPRGNLGYNGIKMSMVKNKHK